MSPEAPLIRVFGESDSLEELTELLHRSYKALAEMGLRYLATHQSAQKTAQRFEMGTCLIALIDERLVGTIVY